MREIVTDIVTWPWFSEPHGYNFNGHLVRHPGGARREDGEVGAALALEPKLRAFEAFAYLVVGDAEVGRQRLVAGIVEPGDLRCPIVLERLRRGRVVPVAIDDHGESPVAN